jgi:Bacterial extracellular solute-binding protein
LLSRTSEDAVQSSIFWKTTNAHCLNGAVRPRRSGEENSGDRPLRRRRLPGWAVSAINSTPRRRRTLALFERKPGRADQMMSRSKLTRRTVLRNVALGTASVVAAPYVRAQYSAGKLSIGAWDHWVPGANETLIKLCHAWADANHIEIKVDFLTSTLTASAEAQARSGHDIIAHPPWQVVLNRYLLEPVDDIVEDLIKSYGPLSPVAAYLASNDGVWRAIPSTIGSVVKPCCSRLDLYKQYCGLDLTKIFPADDDRDPALVNSWNWELYLQTAEQLFNAGSPIGLPMGQSSDAIDWVGALFQSFGAILVDHEGTIQVDSEETRAALEFSKQLMAFTPSGVYGWDDTSNNRFLISGRGSGIINPPSAWIAALHENPGVAEQCWTHDMPRGPKGRFVAQAPFFYGIWSFATNKAAAKALLAFLSARDQACEFVAASNGSDLPLFDSFYRFDTWQKAGPPPGTLYNYPPRGDEIAMLPGWPARPEVAMQIFSQALQPAMVAKLARHDDSIDSIIKWAVQRLESILCLHISHNCA